MDAGAARRAAERLGGARLAALPVPELDAGDRPQSIADGYEIQRALHAWLTARGHGALAGWKIGATTADMQAYLGVDGPAYGRILAANVHADGAALRASDFCHPGIECEIAVRIGAGTGSGPYDRRTVLAHVGAVLPAIEIVENRYGDFLARGTPTLVADDFFHKACVVGADATGLAPAALDSVRGRTEIDGVERGRGTGAAVMGHPLEAVAWLANTLSAHGDRLRAGEIVLTGSVAPVIWLDRFPCTATVALDGLGPISVRFDGGA